MNFSRTTLRSRRGISMLEFVLIMPMFLFLIVFMVDIGRVLMVSTAVQEATYRSARTSAIVGGADLLTLTDQGNYEPIGTSAFEQALRETPGGSSAEDVTVTFDSGGKCTGEAPNNYVTVTVRYNVNFLTPGMSGLLGMAGGTADGVGTGYALKAVSVSRCEVIAGPSGVAEVNQ